MSVNTTPLKLKVLGFGTAAIVGAAMLLGAANSAKAMPMPPSTTGAFACSENAPTADNGYCWNNLASETDSSGDFRENAGWVDRFQTNGGGSDGNWSDLNFLTDGLLKSQFSYQSAFGAQSAANVEVVLEGSDWFGTPLTFVSDGDISGSSWETAINGNVVYIHTGGFSLAFLYDGIPTEDFFIEFVGKGLSNFRVFSTEIAAVPTPVALPLFGAALLGLIYLSRRRKSKALQA